MPLQNDAPPTAGSRVQGIYAYFAESPHEVAGERLLASRVPKVAAQCTMDHAAKRDSRG